MDTTKMTMVYTELAPFTSTPAIILRQSNRIDQDAWRASRDALGEWLSVHWPKCRLAKPVETNTLLIAVKGLSEAQKIATALAKVELKAFCFSIFDENLIPHPKIKGRPEPIKAKKPKKTLLASRVQLMLQCARDICTRFDISWDELIKSVK